jgi:membrane protein DedA with SNARE-associated domain
VEIISEIIQSMKIHPILICLLAGIMGEDYVFLMAILSGSGFMSMWNVVPFGILGVFFHDFCIYWIFRKYHGVKINQRFERKATKRGIDKWLIDWMHRKNYLVALMVSKFIFGARILTIYYITKKENKFKKFLSFDVISILFWFTIMMPLGWMAGRGFVRLLAFVRGLEKVIAVLFVIAFIYYIINKYFARFLDKKEVNSKQIKVEQ